MNYIKTIEDRNDKLQEISWIQSHILRAPLSRTMGLIPLIETSENNDDVQQMLHYLSLAAPELEDVVKDITDKSRIADYKL